MVVYRLARDRFALPLSGKGAALKGARWNSVGVELIYTAMNRSLAMAEVAIHFTLATIPDDYVMMAIEIPESVSRRKLAVKDMPEDWREFPHPLSTQKIGDEFVRRNGQCILIIPSVVTQGDFNVLINPAHKDFRLIKVVDIVKFPFDKRIFR